MKKNHHALLREAWHLALIFIINFNHYFIKLRNAAI